MSNPKAVITVAGMGDITIELYPDKAPKTVANFISLAQDGFYNGLIFHRVIKNFMIQGGGHYPDFRQKPTASIIGEFAANGFPKNNIRHKRGVISMARTSDPNSASSQFFIMHADSPHLDGQYAAFGAVTDGISVVDKIASVRTAAGDVPRNSVVIENISIIQ